MKCVCLFCVLTLAPRSRLRAFLPSGYLVSVDSYMNLQLASTEEWIDGQFSGNLGEVLIRCNNVLHIRGVPEAEDGAA